MPGTQFFEPTTAEAFQKWLRRVVGRDDRYAHLLLPEYEE